jgi:hypothetical protein
MNSLFASSHKNDEITHIKFIYGPFLSLVASKQSRLKGVVRVFITQQLGRDFYVMERKLSPCKRLQFLNTFASFFLCVNSENANEFL